MLTPIKQYSQLKTFLARILGGNASNEQILDKVANIEAHEEEDLSSLHPFRHENVKIVVCSSSQIREGLTLAF